MSIASYPCHLSVDKRLRIDCLIAGTKVLFPNPIAIFYCGCTRLSNNLSDWLSTNTNLPVIRELSVRALLSIGFIWRETSLDAFEWQLMMEAILLAELLTVIADADGVESTSSNLMEVRTEVSDPKGSGGVSSFDPEFRMSSLDWRARIAWLWTIDVLFGIWSTHIKLRATSVMPTRMFVKDYKTDTNKL